MGSDPHDGRPDVVKPRVHLDTVFLLDTGRVEEYVVQSLVRESLMHTRMISSSKVSASLNTFSTASPASYFDDMSPGKIRENVNAAVANLDRGYRLIYLVPVDVRLWRAAVWTL